MAENNTTVENDTLFKRMMTKPMGNEQRALLGTLAFFTIILITGWVGLNEPGRMEEFTAQYDGRSLERGAVLYRDNCSSCHGLDGKGLEGVAPALNDVTMFNGTRLQEVGWAGSLHDYIYLTVAAGRPVRSEDWPQAMPTWSQDYGGPLRPDQVGDVVNYVMNYSRFFEEGAEEVPQVALATPTPAYEAVGSDLTVDLPAGDPTRGEQLFRGQTAAAGGNLACSSCHSLDGSDGVGPTMQGIATSRPPDGYDSLEAYLHESIVQPGVYLVEGFENVMQQNFGDLLTAQDLADLIAYLATLE